MLFNAKKVSTPHLKTNTPVTKKIAYVEKTKELVES